MSSDRLERVLSCRDLPTLPTVALNVLTMARQPDVGLPAIAAAIERDASLAAKVLRTVNSSFFGLKTPCASITRAIGYLGINAVKAIVLGFGLVELTRKLPPRSGFDHESYWKRTIVGASAAKELAALTGVNPDEAMTAGLFSDIGMLAMVVALDQEYLDCLADPDKRHESLPAREMEALGFTHAQCGSGLTQRWAFPKTVSQTIEHSHTPDAAAASQRDLPRTVALGAMVSDLFLSPTSPGASGPLLAAAERWFGLTQTQLGLCLERIGVKAAELARVFDKDLGTIDVQGLLAATNEELMNAQLSVVQERESLRGDNERLASAALIDALTGIGNRKHFDEQAPSLFAQTRERGVPMSVLFLDGDRFKSVNDTHGHAAGDAVLRHLAARIAAVVGARGVVCRYGGEEFAVLLAGIGADDARSLAENIRANVAGSPIDLSGVGGCPATLAVTVSIGVATTEHTGECPSVERLVQSADAAVYEAKDAGRNRVAVGVLERRGVPTSTERPTPAPRPARPRPIAAPPAEPPHPSTPARVVVLLVEDDPLAARLLEAMLQREIGATVIWRADAESAIALVRAMRPDAPRAIDAVVIDLGLPGASGVEVARTIRLTRAVAAIPCVMISASEDASDERVAREAGATAFYRKSQICRDAASWTHALRPAAPTRRSA